MKILDEETCVEMLHDFQNRISCNLADEPTEDDYLALRQEWTSEWGAENVVALQVAIWGIL